MSEIKKMSLILSGIDRASHSAFKKILNKSASSQNVQSTAGSCSSQGRIKAPEKSSHIPSSYNNLPFNLTEQRFEWQTSAVAREVLTKHRKYENEKGRRSSVEDVIKIDLNPKHLPLNEEPITKKCNFEVKYRSTSAIISLKDKKNQPEPNYCPLKKYLHNSKEKPGIVNLIKKTPIEVSIYTKKRIVPAIKTDEFKPNLKQYRDRFNRSQLKGAAKVVEIESNAPFWNGTRNLRNSTSCDNIFAPSDETVSKKKNVKLQVSTNVKESLYYKTARMKNSLAVYNQSGKHTSLDKRNRESAKEEEVQSKSGKRMRMSSSTHHIISSIKFG